MRSSTRHCWTSKSTDGDEPIEIWNEYLTARTELATKGLSLQGSFPSSLIGKQLRTVAQIFKIQSYLMCASELGRTLQPSGSGWDPGAVNGIFGYVKDLSTNN